MKYIPGIIVAIFQFIIGYLTIFFGAMVGLSIILEALGLVGPDNVNPWWNTPLQLISFALAASFGVWIVGWMSAKLRKTELDNRKAWWGTLAGSALAIVIITIVYLVQGAVGFMPVMFALFGALIGFYVYPLIWK